MFINSPRFPEDISYGSSGGPKYNTTVKESLSGRANKNINWRYPLHEYNVGYGLRHKEDLEVVLSFFHVAEGRAHSFRYKDFSDYRSLGVNSIVASTDSVLGVGDGINRTFQLIKNYTVGTIAKTRKITAPVTSTILIALNSIETTAFIVDDTSGMITFTTPPILGVAISAGFEFDVPCSFVSDFMPTSLDDFNSGSIDLRLEEQRV